MRAMVLEAPQNPLRLVNMPIPEPQEGQILLEVKACAACRTDLQIFDGEIPLPRSPLILGHQVVGIVKRLGPKAKRFKIGQRVGAAWVGKTC
ncbi:MAG: alcohol dehydrogenase catalytic domain-containing protein, partial [Parachlamydiales bacterium]